MRLPPGVLPWAEREALKSLPLADRLAIAKSENPRLARAEFLRRQTQQAAASPATSGAPTPPAALSPTAMREEPTAQGAPVANDADVEQLRRDLAASKLREQAAQKEAADARACQRAAEDEANALRARAEKAEKLLSAESAVRADVDARAEALQRRLDEADTRERTRAARDARAAFAAAAAAPVQETSSTTPTKSPQAPGRPPARLPKPSPPHDPRQPKHRDDDDDLQPSDESESYDEAAALATVGGAEASLVDFVRRRLGDAVSEDVDLAKLVENGLMGEEGTLDQPYGSRSWIEFADTLEVHLCGQKQKTRGDHARRRKG